MMHTHTLSGVGDTGVPSGRTPGERLLALWSIPILARADAVEGESPRPCNAAKVATTYPTRWVGEIINFPHTRALRCRLATAGRPRMWRCPQ